MKGCSDDRLWSDPEEATHHLHVAKEGNMAWPLVEEYVIRRRDRAQYLAALEILWDSAAAGASGNQLAQSLIFRIHIQWLTGTHAAARTVLAFRAPCTSGMIPHQCTSLLGRLKSEESSFFLSLRFRDSSAMSIPR